MLGMCSRFGLVRRTVFHYRFSDTPTDHEMVDFMMSRFKQCFRLAKPKPVSLRVFELFQFVSLYALYQNGFEKEINYR